jgi:hypothetical protein
MPLRLPLSVARWMASLGLLKGEPRSTDEWEVSFDDQLYLENGYLVGQLLRIILQARGHASDSLLRIRKIAHISSNENWRIVEYLLDYLAISFKKCRFRSLSTITQFLCLNFKLCFSFCMTISLLTNRPRPNDRRNCICSRVPSESKNPYLKALISCSTSSLLCTQV